ncbi:MAG: hypoxanthine phosphoribosyltransferase [Spirochaetales bacterium]|nr:hypoxanthine phosphoribosyltransferase [Spirochaetales bacterium]
MEHSKLRVLISQEQIQTRVRELGAAISADFAGHELTVIGTLKGCFIFMADLVRNIQVPLNVDFIEVSSYGDSTVSSGVVRLDKDFKHPITDRHVLVVEDIIDTGLTLNYLMENILLRRPASARIAALLVKEAKQSLDHPIPYRGFNIDDHFVVGYGMDYRGYFRNLDHVAIMEDDRQPSLF